MQAQLTGVNTQVVTRTQSLAAVETLLKAGLSCVTFLRNLLPEDNFTESHLTSAGDSFPLSSSETDSGTPLGRRNDSKIKGFRIRTLTRGHTPEGDRLLNYLENGIFDALEKQYLRSFIFAIYLDSKDPNNIVEAYTFNFKYHQVAGSDTPVPVMSLGDDLQNMSLNGRSTDPVADAIRMGRAPTLGDVKKSLKNMMKTLIQAITQMEELPRRRFATFKLFYTDKTPHDYEPPLFQTGDENKDKWYFMTHNLEEVPDRFSVGKANCGYHTVNLKVTSIASYLPAMRKDNEEVFLGAVSTSTAKCMQRLRPTPHEQALVSAKEVEELQDDAKARNLVWSTEGDIDLSDADAEGEDDPDYVLRPDGTYEYKPLGLRNENGEIEEVVLPAPEAETQEAHFAGIAERIPTRLKEINSDVIPKGNGFEETQVLMDTQPMPNERSAHEEFTFDVSQQLLLKGKTFGGTSLPPSNLAMQLESPMTSAPPSPIMVATSSFRGGANLSSIPEDAEMLDLETQPQDVDSQMIEAIESFSLNSTEGKKMETIENASPPAAPVAHADPVKDLGLDCNCTIAIEDEMCFCDGGCGKWFHIWCMGFHSTEDPNLPSKFVCFECRLKADVLYTVIKDSAYYAQIMAKWREFVIFRRAIKVAENMKVITPSTFASSFEGDNSLARQLIKKLEEDDFIHALTTTIDEFGLTVETRLKSKGKDKKSRSRKNVQKTRFAFNKQIKSQQKYKDYFTPEQKVESRMLGMDDLRKQNNKIPSTSESHLRPAVSRAVQNAAQANQIDIFAGETQTQDETQMIQVPREDSQKRNSAAAELERPSKKLKISLALGIDLAE